MEYVRLRSGEPARISQMEAFIRNQKEDFAIVQFFITKDKTFAIYFDAKVGTVVKKIEVSRKYLQKLLFRGFINGIMDYTRPPSNDAWEELSEIFLTPLSRYLEKKKMIYFIPHDILSMMPFHALLLGGRYLIENHAVAYVPSISVLLYLLRRNGKAENEFAAFGFDFESEADKVADIFSTIPTLGNDIKMGGIVEALKNYRIVHFSSHGNFSKMDPLASGLRFGTGNSLSGYQVYDVKAKADLVTLSACQSGMFGRPGNQGEDHSGLVRAFFASGVASVVAGMWSVESVSTEILMCSFYKNILSGLPKAMALQKAQIDLMKNEKYSHPFFWAAFGLHGNWQ